MKLWHCIILLFFTLTARAQPNDSLFRALSAQLALNDTAAHTDLFLHFDKNVYTAGENAWFAAYLLHAAKAQEHHTLYVVLLNETEHRVVSSSRFVLEQGLASASFSIPDSLLSGKYCWIAYTNKSLAEQAPQIFRQPMEVLGLRKEPYELQFAGTYNDGNIAFTGYISQKDNSAALPAKIRLTLLANGQRVQEMDANINNLGQLHFTVPTALAAKRLEVTGTLGRGKQQMAFKRRLSWDPAKSIIEFYPAGGKLLAGWPWQVAVSVRSSSGKAIAAPCVLLEDGAEINSFVTDKTGSGLFSFTPKLKKQYAVKLKGEKELPLQSFPAVTAGTWSIQPVNTLVSDTLRLQITTAGGPGECIIAIHNKRAMLYGAGLKLRKAEASLNIPVAGWEPGIAYVCLYTKDGTLREQRLVFIKNAGSISAVLQTNAAAYRPLDQVTVKLKLTNAQGKPVKGLFSFSSALEQAYTNEAKDIEVYNLMGRFLPDRVLLPPAVALGTEQNIKNMLLWQEHFMADTLWTSPPSVKPGSYDGYVLQREKRPKKMVDLMLMGSQATMLQSTADGSFALPYSILHTDAGKKLILSVVGKNLPDYRIEFTPPWANMDKVVAGQNIWHHNNQDDELTYAQKQLLTSSRNNMLKEVVVTAKKAERGNYGKASISGLCNDYVCQYDVLNCPYHSGVKTPEEGKQYNFETAFGIIKVTYYCDYNVKPLYIKEVQPILNYQPYIPFNPLAQNPPEALNSTTLHWQAFVQTDDQGEATLNFNSNARSGRFKALVQGVTTDGVFSSEVYFEVKR